MNTGTHHMLRSIYGILEVYDPTTAQRCLLESHVRGVLTDWKDRLEAANAIGCMVIPGGAMDSVARLRAVLKHDVTVLCCTPTYALRLGEVALEADLDLKEGSVRSIPRRRGNRGRRCAASRRAPSRRSRRVGSSSRV